MSKEVMGIGEAVRELKRGAQVARAGWNGKGMYLELQVPDAGSKMTLAYVYMRTAQGDLVPWLCSQTDLLAIDWSVVGWEQQFGSIPPEEDRNRESVIHVETTNLTPSELALYNYLCVAAGVSNADEEHVLAFRKRRDDAYEKWIKARSEGETERDAEASLKAKIGFLPERVK